MNPLLVIVAMLVVACGILVAIVKAQAKRADKAKAEAETLHKALGHIERKAVRLQKTLDKQREVEVKADDERKELSGTADADLVHRANNLFM
jgi:Tfp pilus assembly protein PilO